MIISFQYKSDRTELITDIQKYVPVKINFRDGHWLIIGWDMNENKWKQYLIHSLLDVKICYNSIQENDPLYFKELPDFDIAAFYSNSYGIAVLDDIEPVEIIIQVPSDKVLSVRKRRKEGIWENKGIYTHWIIRSINPDEVMDYVFKWNGILKIISPQEVVNKFQERLKIFLNE
jgi:predicted DNA-binding transcriptional regulator YafY